MAVRITIGCFNSQRLNTLKQIIIGNWLNKAALRSPKIEIETRPAAQRL
jgi:hypothetical protein